MCRALLVLSCSDAPDDAYWVKIGGDRRVHPYGMHRKVNRNTVEVVASSSDGDNYPKRWVLVKNGTHEVWVKVADQNKYGYPLHPEERVSEAELKAIALKQAALRDGSNVAVTEAQALIDTGKPVQRRHALIALYYAAKADPDISARYVDRLREVMHEQTGHVDTSQQSTLQRIIRDVDSLAG